MAQAPSHARKLEELEQRIAVLKHFDKSMENTGKSLEATHDDIVQSIESLLQWAESESVVLCSKDSSLCGEEHVPCSDQDTSLALENLAASLGIAPLDPYIGLYQSDASSTLTSSKLCAQASSSPEDTVNSETMLQPGAHGGNTVPRDELLNLDAKLMKIEATTRCVQEAHQKVCLANLDGDEVASATDPFKCAISYWMQLLTILGSDREEKNHDESANLSEPSFLDRSHDEGSLLAYKDALDQHIQDQRLSLQQHLELRGRLKQDIHFMDQVIAHLAAENQRLIEETKRKLVQGKKSATRKAKLLSSELQWLGRGMQIDSVAARACLHTANMSATAASTAAEEKPAEHSDMMAVQEACRNAILQEYCSYLDNIMKDEDRSRLQRDRLERRAARAEALLTSIEKTFREKDPIAGSLQVLETIKDMRMWQKALPLVEGKVDGRTFAEWLPDILQLIGEPDC